VLNGIGVGLQMLHVVLQPAILLLQAQNFLLQHLVLVALLLISRQAVSPEGCVVSKQEGDDYGHNGGNAATRTRKVR
jgi:hypothetical protein